jgi:hypothetical protein
MVMITVESHKWLAFTPDTSHDYATKRFVARFGYIPHKIFTHRGLLLAGPIGFVPDPEKPEEEEVPEIETLEPEEDPVGQLELFA